MTELLLAGQTNDAILDSLSYRLAPTSAYIQQRRMSRFYPSGASSYSSNTTQIARIELKGQGGFLDLSTLKIAFRLVNNSSTQHLILAGGPHALISDSPWPSVSPMPFMVKPQVAKQALRPLYLQCPSVKMIMAGSSKLFVVSSISPR